MVSLDRVGPKSGFNWARIAINQLMDRYYENLGQYKSATELLNCKKYIYIFKASFGGSFHKINI